MKKQTDGWGVYRRRSQRCRTVTHKEEPSVGPGMVEILPLDLLEAIMCCVASISGEDYRRCRHTCKTFYEISNEKVVLQKLNFRQVSVWTGECRFWPRGHKFLDTLAENDNPRALFQLGVREFCTLGMMDEGLKKLEKASLLGYTTAKYALGVIKLGGSEAQEGRDEGRRLITEVKSEVGLNISECRRTLFNRIRCSLIWKDKVLHKYYPLPYTLDDHCDTCCMMCWWADSALMFGENGLTGEGLPIVEIAHTAKCHACEWILESRVFLVYFDL